MMKKKKMDLDGVFFIQNSSRKSINEFKKIFARSLNLSNVDKKMWKLTLQRSQSGFYILNLYLESKIFSQWGVLEIEKLTVDMDDLKEFNILSEKLFTEEWIYGIKDSEALESMIGSVDNGYFGIEPYPTIVKKATYYWYHIATKQMFHNGNKRTALLTALIFLEFNGYKFLVTDKNILYNISVKVANRKMSFNQLYDYILRNTQINFEWATDTWKSLVDKQSS